MDRKDEKALHPVADDALATVCGALWKRQGSASPGSNVRYQPGYTAPTVLLDDGLNIQTTDPSTTNVGYDSPWTPIFPL